MRLSHWGYQRGQEPARPLERPNASTLLRSRAFALLNSTSIVAERRLIRGQKVLLDSDLAGLYGVETRVLVQAVKRNRVRFPDDFAFQLTTEEFQGLRSQSVISNGSAGRGGRRYRPYVFTEHGAIMAASILNSERAVQTSVLVVRAFVRLRQMLASNDALAARLRRLEKTVGAHSKQIVAIVDAIQMLMPPPEGQPKEPFGFRRARKN